MQGEFLKFRPFQTISVQNFECCLDYENRHPLFGKTSSISGSKKGLEVLTLEHVANLFRAENMPLLSGRLVKRFVALIVSTFCFYTD